MTAHPLPAGNGDGIDRRGLAVAADGGAGRSIPFGAAAAPRFGHRMVIRIARSRRRDRGYWPVAPGSRAMRLAEVFFQRFADVISAQLCRSLVVQLQACKFLPRKLASIVANDVETVALPSVALADIAADGGLSVARPVSPAAGQPDRGESSQLAEIVVRADVAEGEESIHLVIEFDRAGHAGPVPPVDRLHLPLGLVQQTAGEICRALRHRLIERHGIPEPIAARVVAQCAEQAWTDLIAAAERPVDVDLLADRLHAQDRLTPTLLLRALFYGQVEFFDAGLAALAGIEPGQVRALIRGGRPEDYKVVYRRAGLPPVLYRAFRAGIEVVINGSARDPGTQPVRSRERGLVARLIADYQDLGPQSLQAILSRLSARV